MDRSNATEDAVREQRYLSATGLVGTASAAAYVVLRFLLSGPVALLASQVIFVGAPLAAAVFSAIDARKSPVGSRSRRAWALLALAMALLTVSETAYAWYTLVDGLPADPVGGIGDYASATATLVFLGLIAVSSPARPADRTRTPRVLLDLLTVGTLAFSVGFRVWILTALETSSSAAVAEAARLSLYAAVGVVVVAGALLVLGSPGPGRSRLWLALLRGGIATFGAAVVAYPVWYLTIHGRGAVWVEALTDVLFLVGYVVIGAAAYARMSDNGASSSWGGRATGLREIRTGVLMSTLTMVSLLALAWATAVAPSGSSEETVYFVALVVAEASIVLRTALGSADVRQLRRTAETDALTGVAAAVRVDERCAELSAAWRRFKEPYFAALVDVDDFAVLRARGGQAFAEDVLRRVGDSICTVVDRASVFRVATDRFLVLASCESPAEASVMVWRVFESIRMAPASGSSASVSVGHAVCPRDSEDARELVRMAEAALAWAKRHGKQRVVAHDEDILASLGLPGRELLCGPAQLELARALSIAIEAHDPAGHRHARTVASLAVLLGHDLGLDSAMIARLQLAALLHDVGRLAVPPFLSARAAKSREAARRRHAELGAQMLESLDIEEVTLGVRAHHERWDGHGYPDGASGEQIPLAARIIALADAYDVMTSDGPEGAVRSKAAALQEIDLGLGARFDPMLGERFIKLVGTRGALGWSNEWPAA